MAISKILHMNDCGSSFHGKHLKTALNYLTSFVERIENEASNVDGIGFISAQHIGPRAIPIGKNDFNIIVCKSTIDLKYIFTM